MSMNILIMAGGKGTRFWPLSRSKKPKQFMDIVSDDPMIVDTLNRFKDHVDFNNVYVATNVDYVDSVHKLIPELPIENIIGEPVGRNTAPCIGLISKILAHLKNDNPLVVLPSDHVIKNVSDFMSVVQKAVNIASVRELIFTIGIQPTFGDTSYGYIEKGDEDNEGYFKLKRFAEKPDVETANKYFESGNYFWNGGIFVAKPLVWLNEIKSYMPELDSVLNEFNFSKNLQIQLNNIFPKCPNMSVDYGIMEHTICGAVIPGTFDWSDVGSFHALFDVMKNDKNGNILKGNGLLLNSKDSMLLNYTDQLIVLSHLDRKIAVATSDAMLIVDRDAPNALREVYAAISDLNSNVL